MRDFSHLTGFALGGAAIVVAAGSFALTPAAGSHAVIRHQSVERYAAPGVRAAGATRQARERSAARAGAMTRARFLKIMPGGPMVLAGGSRAGARWVAQRASEVQSANWAGYAATRRGQPFRFVGGTFFVPYVNCSTTPDSFSAHWIGLDGFNTDTVEQAGVLAACSGGNPHYAAWYEMFPRVPVYPHIAIRPGDSVTVSVFFQRSTRRFMIALTDTSNGAHFSASLACLSGSTCQRASAEVISEPPSSGSQILPLTDFRGESFTGVRVTDQTGHRGTLRSRRWNTVKIINVNPADNAVLDQPTQLFQGTAFDNYWMRPT
jgi:hypothetical protein